MFILVGGIWLFFFLFTYGPKSLLELVQIGVCLGVVLMFLRQGTKPVFVEAQVWTFDKSQQQFQIRDQYYDRRTSRRWQQTVQTHPLPISQAISEQDNDNMSYILINMGETTVECITSYYSHGEVIQQIQQFLED